MSNGLRAGLIIGTVLGSAVTAIIAGNPPEPETRVVVKTIEPPPKIVVRDKIERVTLSLPESCKLLPEEAARVESLSNKFQGKAKDFYAELKDVDYRVLEDQTANNDLVIRVNKIIDGQSTALYDMFFATEKIGSLINQCEADIEAQKD